MGLPTRANTPNELVSAETLWIGGGCTTPFSSTHLLPLKKSTLTEPASYLAKAESRPSSGRRKVTRPASLSLLDGNAVTAYGPETTADPAGGDGVPNAGPTATRE